MRHVFSNSLALVLVSSLSLHAGAQEGESSGSGQTEVEATPVDSIEDEPEIEQVPDAEKGERANSYIASMKGVLRTVLGFLEEAREERDVVKLNCINEKLTAVKGLLRISEASDLTLREALARRDPDAAGHEFEKIAIASRKIDQLRAESEACVGELAVYSGDTQVEIVVTGEPPAPSDPASTPPVIDVVVRPPAASPTAN